MTRLDFILLAVSVTATGASALRFAETGDAVTGLLALLNAGLGANGAWTALHREARP